MYGRTYVNPKISHTDSIAHLNTVHKPTAAPESLSGSRKLSFAATNCALTLNVDAVCSVGPRATDLGMLLHRQRLASA